jgi:DNA-directed RNA polymerase subunit RPC12/RpoP
MDMTMYVCGNCHGTVTLSSVKCSDGSIHTAYVCSKCGCSWFPWQIKRDVAWQAREDERRERATRAVKP